MKRFLLFSLVLFSCTIDQQKLPGKWQAVAYFEDGKTVQTPLDSVRITLSSSGEYTFNSIGYYSENGTYRVAGQHLMLQEKGGENNAEKSLKILFLSADSLKIGMQAEKKSQVVFFARQ